MPHVRTPKPRIRTLMAFLALSTAAVIATGIAAPLVEATGIPVAAVTSTVAWQPCGGKADPRQECGSVSVPMDYAVPAGARISLAVSRVRAAGPDRHGVLLFIPGGPGSTGLGKPGELAGRLPAEVLARYDVVSFDPRGLGKSSPVDCRPASPGKASAQLMPWPGPDGDIAPNVSWAAEMATACGEEENPLTAHISTRNEARDIDAIRAALGEEKLSYWGVSYGTYVGAVYATMYPDRTDRVVLDSNDDPDPGRLARGWAANYAIGAEDRFPDFAAWAAARDAEYHLGVHAAAVRDAFLTLATRLDGAPLPWTGAQPPTLDGNALRAAMLQALYSDKSFPGFAALMSAALRGEPLPAASAPPAAALQNTAAVLTATICNDVRWPRSVDGYAEDVATNRAAYPLTAGMPVNIYACAFWPEPSEDPVTVSPDGPANVLMIQNLRDPSTPYVGALRMRAAFGDRARMVTVDAGGHGSYLANGNACGDGAVTAFLVTGERPADDVSCR
ncbi:alpha/beta hydrolase [Actinoplanes utahensis]|uniref:Peptidase S33 tripeptidyl aminopeptidase-like C-terminal domain-containing protein n=1 Tax=Actinoplanes utahensis TaxID=1869 RepID=A0A0A6UL41_ACTUT|nr:alpha/beta hydrolase [Actinoplanes utahensis]KHD76810.1 hypothetical protein MB27_14790 [Actinoplanes utahensis]